MQLMWKTLNCPLAAVAHAAPVPAFHSHLEHRQGNVNLKSKNKGSSTMVVPVRRRLRTKTPPAAAQRVPSMGLVRRRMRSKGPPPQPQPQPHVPAGSGGVPGPAHPGGGEPPAGDGLPGFGDRPQHSPGLPPQSPVVHQEMEEIQEEAQEEMTAKPHRTLIKTSTISSIVDRQRIQTQVVMMVEEDAGHDTRLL